MYSNEQHSITGLKAIIHEIFFMYIQVKSIMKVNKDIISGIK